MHNSISFIHISHVAWTTALLEAVCDAQHRATKLSSSPPADGVPVVVHSTPNADEATLLFAAELQRLLSDRADGELAIRRKFAKSAKADVIVRQQVSSPHH